MEVRKGYKQTEDGVIPDSWDLSYLGELCFFKNGDRGKNYPSRNSFASDGIPFINAGHVEGGQINLREMNYIPKESFDLLRGGKVKSGDVLFCLRGSLGKFGVVGEGFGDGAIASSLVIIRPKPTKLKLNYLTSYLKSKYCVQMIERWAGGAAQPNLGVQDLVRFVIPLPPTLAEQEAIAEALSDADALIESLETLLAKKHQVKQGAMSELLTGKRRLPEFVKKQGYKQTEVGTIPEDWNVQSLGSVVVFLDGQRRPVKDSDRAKMKGDIPYYGASGIVDYVNDYLFDDDLILLGEDGENIVSRNTRLAFRVSGKIWVNNHAHVLKPHSHINIGFLTDFLESLNYESYNSGTAQPKLNKQTCYGIPIAIPPTYIEQTAIAEILSDMDAEIRAVEEKLSKARAVKAGMMSELLTGRVRLV